MCGIVGIVNSQGIVDKASLAAATNALAHRGPDGHGLWLSADNKIGLGHRRLAIIDADSGQQPLFDETGSIGIVVNGEFYDEIGTRKMLESKGHCFRTGSDSEILIFLYREFGLGFTEYLRGEFAFILYDVPNRRLVAGRDRFGIKPLCYHYTADHTLYLASEAKAIFAAGIRAQWDIDALAYATSFQYIPQNRTMFKEIRQLPPGHLLVHEKEQFAITSYWDMDLPLEGKESHINEKDIIPLLRHHMEDAIASRLRSGDAGICCHLSGGIDSASVAAIASKLHGSPLPCFTVAFSHAMYDESAVAQRMAKKIGAEFHAVPVSADDMAAAFPDAVYYTEGFAINGHLAAKFLLNRAIRNAGFKVALSGEGSDEVLLGYPHLKLDMLGGTDRGVSESNPISMGVQISDADTLPVGALQAELGYIPSFVRAKAAIGLQIHSLMAEEFRNSIVTDTVYANIATPFHAQLSGRQRVNQSAYLWTKYALAGYILKTLGDGCEMAHAIEGRTPFLDHRLFELVKQIPVALKIHNGVEKYILREAVKDYITPEIYVRQKHPFMAPPLSLLTNAKGWQFINDILRSENFKRLGFFDIGKITTYLDALPEKSVQDQIAAEPALMLMLSCFFLAQRYQL